MKNLLQLVALTLGLALSTSFAQVTPVELPSLNIDIKETSVSGISSGGFMAVQLAVAYSSIIKGAGIVAAGPYYCSQGDLTTAGTKCSCTLEPYIPCAVTDSSANVPRLISKTQSFFTQRIIDDPANIARQRILTFTGGNDKLVPLEVVEQLNTFYRRAGLPEANLAKVVRTDAGHTMPTWNSGEACNISDSPYIGRCHFDGAKEILSWIYGPGTLKAPARDRRRLDSRFVKFDQRPFIPTEGAMAIPWKNGLDDTGWLYVPDACRHGAACRLHVVLHGCKQGQSYLPLKTPPDGGLFNDTTFVKNAGYARWADTNDIVVLFPQAISIPWDINPNGCWDWWGFTGSDHYADQKGFQMRAIRAMIDRLTSGGH